MVMFDKKRIVTERLAKRMGTRGVYLCNQMPNAKTATLLVTTICFFSLNHSGFEWTCAKIVCFTDQTALICFYNTCNVLVHFTFEIL